MRPHRTRLSVDLPIELMETMKRLARKRNITLTRWVLRACFRRVTEERIEEEERS